MVLICVYLQVWAHVQTCKYWICALTLVGGCDGISSSAETNISRHHKSSAAYSDTGTMWTMAFSSILTHSFFLFPQFLLYWVTASVFLCLGTWTVCWGDVFLSNTSEPKHPSIQCSRSQHSLFDRIRKVYCSPNNLSRMSPDVVFNIFSNLTNSSQASKWHRRKARSDKGFISFPWSNQSHIPRVTVSNSVFSQIELILILSMTQ